MDTPTQSTDGYQQINDSGNQSSTINKITNVSIEMIQLIKKANNIMQNFKTNKYLNKELITLWLNKIKSCIFQHNKILRFKNDLNIGSIRKLNTNKIHLKFYQNLLKQHLNGNQNSNINIKKVGGLLHKKNRNTKTIQGTDIRSNRVKWIDLKSAFNSRIRSGVILNIKHTNINEYFEDCYFLFQSRIKNILKKDFSLIKVNACFCGEFTKVSIKSNIQGDNDEEIITEFKYFNTKNEIIDKSTDLLNWFQVHVIDKIFNSLSEFQEMLSGFGLSKIHSLEININKFEIASSLLGSSYIELPKEIANKHACVNVQNFKDNACFAWAILSALYPVKKNNNRTTSYPNYKDIFNLYNITFPMPIKDILIFEKNNNLSINVYGLQLKRKTTKSNKSFFNIVPLRLTKNKLIKHVNLLIIQNRYDETIEDDLDQEEEELILSDNNLYEIKYHYVWIKSLSRLIRSQSTKHTTKIFICDRCLNYFKNKKTLDEHIKICEQYNNCKISFPKYDYLEFKNHNNLQEVPYILYSDIESILTPVNNNNTKFDVLTKSLCYQKHIAHSIGYYFNCTYDNTLSYYKSYRIINKNQDPIQWFCNELKIIAKFIDEKLKTDILDPKKKEEYRKNNIPNKCHICDKNFKKNDNIVVEHEHVSKKIRGYAHSLCNLNFRKKRTCPCIFHNMINYDLHFLIRRLAKYGNIKLVPLNKEKYISFTVKDYEYNIYFRFIDSYRFLNSSIDHLSSILTDFPILASQFKNLNAPDKISLLQRKGVFPYDYIDSLEKLNETKLPPINCFYNRLNDKNLSTDDYLYAVKMFELFECKTLGEYSDYYLKIDVCLLAEIFENFRVNCMKTHKLDPAHYITLPSYSFDCMLKFTKCKLQILKDIDMVLFWERSVRGGISQCMGRFSIASNKYINKDKFDSTLPDKYIIYVDMNNLYGGAQMEYLPIDEFKWIEKTSNDFNNIVSNILSIPDDSSIGYMLEVDLEYPYQIHDLHRDLPFCPIRNPPPNSKIPKLLTTLHDKHNYVLHYRNLKHAINHGLILKSVHRILQFNQSDWLKPYIELNTELRAKATNSFTRNLMKLLNNAVYGKFLESDKKKRNILLARKWEGKHGARNLIAAPNFHSRVIFDEDLMAIELNKVELIYNKPLYVGSVILDLSKLTMYSFLYDFLLKKFARDKIKILYIDTDSFFIEFTNIDPYEQMIKPNINLFDTSDFSPNNQWHIPLANRKVPCKMTDELSGKKFITNFIGLRSKMYTFKMNEDNGCVKKSKGIKMCVVKNKLTYDDYYNCLKNEEVIINKQCIIKSQAHNVFSIEQSKICLSPFDDKRYIIPETHDTLPYGHYSIVNNENFKFC